MVRYYHIMGCQPGCHYSKGLSTPVHGLVRIFIKVWLVNLYR